MSRVSSSHSRTVSRASYHTTASSKKSVSKSSSHTSTSRAKTSSSRTATQVPPVKKSAEHSSSHTSKSNSKTSSSRAATVVRKAAATTVSKGKSTVVTTSKGVQGNVKNVIHKMEPHNLPKTGNPNSVGKQYDDDGNLARERSYGSNGKAVKDKDYKHGGNHEFPHEHDWDWSTGKGQRGNPHSPTDDGINKILGAGIILGAGVAMAAVAADDISGIGVADDGAEVPLSAALAKGVAMVFG